ncbi:hypothetical protein CGC56_07740 [Capnocytophaga canimorsus]|uniref:Uncharacterized protein n=1 Tax=Capnocytophaga canimorsus TaxID=28188 RepID=A0A250G422_9FLAO|nr:hypothetical protein [Capnocytophaga canimorsus]ATA92053.1 hypothetical protein CGC56_07740 [Capnocytophaga canimorsus]
MLPKALKFVINEERIIFSCFAKREGTLSSAIDNFIRGMAGVAVDAGFDIYENSLYDDTLNYITRYLSEKNRNSKGINIIAKTK